MHHYRTFVLFLLLATAVQIQAAVKPITIEKPAGGEMYLPGQTQTVVLNAKTRAKSILIELSRDGGATFETLGTIDNTVTDKAARNRLQWTVDEPYSSDAVIHATSTDPRRPGDGTSDSFAIGAPTGDGSGELYVLRSGDTMTGALTLSGDPAAASQAATKSYVDTKILSASASLDFGTVTNFTAADSSGISVPGAAVGDVVVVTPNTVLNGRFLWTAYISAADTVVVRVRNTSTFDTDPDGSGTTWNIRVLK